MSETKAVVSLTLKYPIQHGSETITELVAERRLKAKDFRGIKSTEIKFDDMLTLIGRLFAVPDSVVNELDACDMQKANELVSSFLESSPETGKKQ